jgi:hypothetical protein
MLRFRSTLPGSTSPAVKNVSLLGWEKPDRAPAMARGFFDEHQLEGSRFSAFRRTSHISLQGEEGLNIRLNKRLPRIAQRDVLFGGQFRIIHFAPKDKPSVGSFAGAACLKRFVAIYAPRKIARVYWLRPKAAPLQFSDLP